MKVPIAIFVSISFVIVRLLISVSGQSFEIENSHRKEFRQYDLLSLTQDIFNRIRHASVLNTVPNQFFFLNEFEFDENDDPLLDYFAYKNISSKCLRDIFYTLENLKNMQNPWAIKLLDSYGKVESGILEGNFKWLGNYLECIDVYAPPAANTSVGNFNGKYCSLAWSIQASENMSLPFTTGICIPDTCRSSELSDDFVKLLRIAKSVQFLNANNSFVNITSLDCKENSKVLNAPTIAVICVISFFVLLVVLGSFVTAYEYYFGEKSDKLLNAEKSSIIINEEDISENQDADVELLFRHNSNSGSYFEVKTSSEKCKPYFKCFCIFTNGSKLLSTDQTEGQLLCIHGIRFLSMSWVILGHSYGFSFQAIDNLLQAANETDNFPFQIVYQAFFSVDSFFVLSGFLLTYLFMQECHEKRQEISWIYFYIHRYLRLTPVYMIILGVSSTIYFYLGSGPNWPDNDVDPVCTDWWWTNLLYINNFYGLKHQCMGWSWYLANDMQFFIISPMFLITLWKWPKVGYSLIGIFLIGTFFANFFITYHYELFAGVTDLSSQATDVEAALLKFSDYFEKLYIKPYTRIGPYLIGIFTGYLVFKAKAASTPKMNQIVLLGGWFVASSVTLACVYSLYHKHLSVLAASFYNGVSRIVFSAGLCWVIYVCLTEQGGFVDKILSFKLFIPLSRLTYSAYLIHPLFLTGYYASLKATFTFSHSTLVLLFLGFMLVTYSFALLVSLIFESPIICLEKLIRSKFNSHQL